MKTWHSYSCRIKTGHSFLCHVLTQGWGRQQRYFTGAKPRWNILCLDLMPCSIYLGDYISKMWAEHKDSVHNCEYHPEIWHGQYEYSEMLRKIQPWHMRYIHIYWNQLLPDLNMDPFSGMFHVLLLCSYFLFVNVCYVTYTKQPTAGHRCVASLNTELTLWQTDRSQCVRRCLKLKTCRYINYNYETRQCDVGLDKCESLVPAVGVAVSVFGPPETPSCIGAQDMSMGVLLLNYSFPIILGIWHELQ